MEMEAKLYDGNFEEIEHSEEIPDSNIPEWLWRVIKEYGEMVDRYLKLSEMLYMHDIDLPDSRLDIMDEEEIKLLYVQQIDMVDYIKDLANRIKLHNIDNPYREYLNHFVRN